MNSINPAILLKVALESKQPLTEIWSFINADPHHTLPSDHFIAIQAALENHAIIQRLPQHPRKGLRYMGVIIPNIFDSLGSSFINELLLNLKQFFTAHQIPYLIYGQRDSGFANIPQFVKHLSGVVLMCSQQTTDIIIACETYNTPFVAIEPDRVLTSPLGVTIRSNNRAAQQLAIEKLIALGHRQIAYIAGDLTTIYAQERLKGYYDALEQAGLACNEALVREGDWHEQTAHRLAQELLTITPRPTAFACVNDLSALGVYAAVEEYGLHVGKDVAVTGFDDLDICEQVTPTLSSLHQSAEHMALLAWANLTELLQGRTPEQSVVEVTAEWIGRDSVQRFQVVDFAK